MNFLGVPIMPLFSWRRPFCWISTLQVDTRISCLLWAPLCSQNSSDGMGCFSSNSWAFTFRSISAYLHCSTCPLTVLILCQRWLMLKYQNTEVNNTTHTSATFFKGSASQRKNWIALWNYGSSGGANIKRCCSYSYSVLFLKLWSLPYYVRLHPRDVTVLLFEDAQSTQATTTLKTNILCISIWIFMSRMIFCVDTGIFPFMICTDTAKYRKKKRHKMGKRGKPEKKFFFLNWTE